jgi:hypothetical protein
MNFSQITDPPAKAGDKAYQFFNSVLPLIKAKPMRCCWLQPTGMGIY